jgi:hypothetical protein
MFIGHFGVGLATKKIDSKPSLGTLFIASQFIDLLWPVFLLFGMEKVQIEQGNTAMTPLNFISYPYSHSLFGVFVWAILLGTIYYILKKNFKTSLLLGLLVLSHWILDLITHRPDLQLLPWSNFKMGLGLWNSVALTIIVEGFIFVLGAYFYLSATKSKNKKGSYGLWGLLIFLTLIYVTNIISTPPSDTHAIAIVGLFQWLLIAWAYWIDRNRKTT